MDRSALALARALIPGSARIPAADARSVRRAGEVVGEIAPWLARAWAVAQRTLDLAAIARTGRRLSALDPEHAESVVRAWQRDPLLRQPLNVVSVVYKMVHFDQPHVMAAMGGRPNVAGNLDRPRWLGQIHRADAWDGGAIDCDVVVVGTGAGGAVVGRELAERGHAVVFVEEGEHYRRDAFDGSIVRAHQRFYRAAASVGNVVMPIFIGRLVGGSTAINGGTCFRTPPWILDRWCEQLATDELSREAMQPHFERVEAVLGVEPAAQREVGAIASVIARGCDALGWRHFAIRRNARGCTGLGFCDFGCATDARRSTNLSYIPPALEAGALLLTGLRVERVIVEAGRAVGVEGVSQGGKRHQVRARAVVLAGGSVPTPLLLLRQGLANGSGEVGKNLTLHPSASVAGVFDEDIDPQNHIPQGYGCDQFLREGQLITAAQPTANVAAQIFQLAGQRLMNVLDQLDHVASIGVCARDASANGRVWRDVAGRPAITYSITREDRDRLHSGMVRMLEILRAAGARRLYAGRSSWPELAPDELAAYRESPPSPSELALASYHPLGTCRMGRDRKTSVVGLDHQSHDVPGLYITDGSTVPGAPGVNPQLTIMAMATRAAGFIAGAL
ncbi:MAG TPA: GMC family oxidoreductase [Kofleriaceae bacterium]|nr:GMC family oxidoreductase [Kofleriaceae bacterium]